MSTLGSGIAHGGQLLRKDGFTITIPDGWKEIPRDVIDEYENEMLKKAPNATKEHYDYGFQLKSVEKWFEYPYMLIQNKSIGKIPKKKLDELENYKINSSFKKNKKDLRFFLSDIRRGKTTYDKKEMIIWMRLEMNIINIGAVTGLSGIVPTEKGVIQVNGYALKRDFAEYKQMFRMVTTSILPAEELVYKAERAEALPPSADRIVWRKVVPVVLGLGMVALIIAAIISFAIKRKKLT